MQRLTPASRALIVGAGIGGLSAALTLSRAGWVVDVAEIKEVNYTVGVGLNHPANALRALRSLGLLEEVKRRGYQYRGIRRYDADGVLTAAFEPENPPDVPFQVSMPRADLHEILTTAVEESGARIRLGLTWRSLEQRDNCVDVEFTDGTARTYDLVVGADGIRSPLRAKIFGTAHEPQDTGYACWRLAVPRRPELIFSEYWNAEDAKASVLHLSDKLMYLFVVEPGTSTSAPPRDMTSVLLRKKLEKFGGLIGEIRETITDSSEIHWAALQEVFLPAPWFKGNVILIGDAAHAVTPHLAQGAGMAMEDALVLADELTDSDTVEQGLTAFMNRRFDRVKYVQDQARAILMNEMESDAERKAAFAATLGQRQSEITTVLARPA